MQKTLEQLIDENQITVTDDGQIQIGSIGKTVPPPGKGIDPAGYLDGVVRSNQRQKGRGATGSFPAQPVEASLNTVSGPGQLQGPMAGIARGGKNLTDFPGQVVDAFGKPPETDVEKFMSRTPYGNLVTGAKRMILDPMAQSAETARQSEATGHPIRAGAESLFSMIPGLGPILTNLTERATTGGDPSGAIAEGATMAAGAKVAEEGPAMLKDMSGHITEPLAKAGVAASDRMLHSLIRPDKKAFDFGADPIAEAKKLPASNSEKAMQKANQANMAKSEAELEVAAADRASAAEQIGVDDGIDIEPFVRDPIQREIQIAKDNNNTALAASLEGFLDAQLNRIRRKYGDAYLKPTEIIAEKRTLSGDTKFAADPVGHNLNVARMEIYKGMDGALDKLLPQAKEINRAYAGQIELDKLLDKRTLQSKNAPVLGNTMFETAKKAFPETAIKTRISRAGDKGAPAPIAAGGQAYEFFPKPKPGPYEAGYRPTPGQIGPKTRGAPAEEGGVYRPGEAAPYTPRTAGPPATEGGVHRPGEPAPSRTVKRSGPPAKEGGVHRPGTKAEDQRFPE